MALLTSLMALDTDIKIKIVIVGDSGVGKTNLISRFTKNVFHSETKPTIGVEFDCVGMEIEGRRLKTQLWDTAGAEKYRAVTNAYYSGASGIILVYDITRRQSFLNIGKWLAEVREKETADMVTILVGNKYDLRDVREVSTSEGREYAEQNDLLFLEASAQDSINVENVFKTLIEDVCSTVKRHELVERRRSEQLQQSRIEELMEKSQSLPRGTKPPNAFYKRTKPHSLSSIHAKDDQYHYTKKLPKLSKKVAVQQVVDLQQQKDKLEERLLLLEREKNQLKRQVTLLRVENDQLRKTRSCENLDEPCKQGD